MTTRHAASYEPYLIETDPSDGGYTVSTIKRVNQTLDGSGWYVTTADNLSLFVPQIEEFSHTDPNKCIRSTPEPQVGSKILVFGGLGEIIRGIIIDLHVVFYRTPEMQEQHRRRVLEDHKAQRRRRYSLERAEHERNFDRLYPVFQTRVLRFRAEDPEFIYDSEPYEVFCLLEAQKIYEYCSSLGSVTDRLAYRDMNDIWRELEDVGVASDQHSNNTFTAAVQLALYLNSFEEPSK